MQWHQPDWYGQDKLVIKLGALHTEMVILACLGDWLQDSGCTVVLSNSGVTSSGNESLLSGHDVAATNYAHQVTAFVPNILMQDASQKSQENLTDEEDFSMWRKKNEDLFPQFQYWSIAQDYLLFFRASRSRDFSLYLHAQEKILLWIFVFDQYNYAR